MFKRRLAGPGGLEYFLYLPRGGSAGRPLFVAVHGISRNAWEHAQAFAPLAERYAVPLVAPLFSQKDFPAYQRLVEGSGAQRPDLVLERLVEEVGMLSGARTDRLRMFGFSGGGQFVHRFALVHPRRVARYAMGAPGWYTFPDEARRFPRGWRPSRRLPGLCLKPRRCLKIPACVLVGEFDVERDEDFNTAARLDRQQGANRLERGRNWVAAMQQAARSRGLETPFRFQVLASSDHAFMTCMTAGQMGEAVFRFLFGKIRRG
ncbi:hypothetical protein DESUT3_29010 [Desulfuromonas versatilis]|uniref:Alpha/beta hydrolase n=1 Tax=Desulfuromonas versatilis TaxID=2802975 RepID=A0ABN6E0I7_9BACT|nr:hypothetical protein [Desulfuromonas versatilis]BCR05832.1 hypothetical protein DESUT3_29010 [Desulfuromonas versatilis]